MLFVLRLIVFAMIVNTCGTARAQVSENDRATALKTACRTDYRNHCTGNDPAAPVAAACLAQFYVNLSKNCQTALEAYNRPADSVPE